MDNNEIAIELASKRCPAHELYPVIKIERKEFKIICCCENFRSVLTERLKQLLSEQMNDDLSAFGF